MICTPDAHAEAEEAAHVGEEVDDAEEFRPLLPHEVQRLEVHVHHGQVVGHVGVVAVVGSLRCGRDTVFKMAQTSLLQ